MKPSDNEIEMLAAGFALQHKNGLIRFAHALLEKYASARAITFDDWLAKHCDSDDLTAYERELAWDAWNAALSAPQASEAVRDAIETCAKICDGRSASLMQSQMLTASNEAHKCGMAIRSRAKELLSLSAQPGAQKNGGGDAE